MKKLTFVCAIVAVMAFTSCTDEDKIVPNEKQQKELFGINKEDVVAPGGGTEDPDLSED